MAFADGRLVVWINAFIPRDVPGYTVPITRGENAGKTAVPLPKAARFPIPFRNNLIKPLNTGYLTDQRSFSTDANASVRMQSLITIDLPAGQVRGLHQTSGTTEVNTQSGETQDNADAAMYKCRHSRAYSVPYQVAEFLYNFSDSFRTDVLKPYASALTQLNKDKPWIWNSQSRFGLMVNVKGAASDPCVVAAADIDYNVTFVVGVDQQTPSMSVACIGFIDDFPAFEAYAKYLGRTKTLFNVPPPPGNTVVNLLGAANRPVIGATMLFGPQVRTAAPTSPQPNFLNYSQ